MKKTAIFAFIIFTLILPFFAEALELNPIAAEDIQKTEDSKIISMDLLRPTENVTSEGIRRTKNVIEQAKQGLLPKREPLTVVIRGDGTYEIFDGNKTYTVLKELGAKNIPVKILRIPYQKDIKILDELYAKNSEEEIYNTVEKLKAKNYFVNFYDRWKGQSYPDNYRDYLTHVRLSNGIITEVQLCNSNTLIIMKMSSRA